MRNARPQKSREAAMEFASTLPVTLTDQQLDAVRTVDGPVLLLAVPGSGKTTVLVARLGFMIQCCGIDPERVLTVTYTVSAARDMSARFSAFFGCELAEHVEFRTINGICAKIIAYYGRVIGREPFRLITDEKQSAQILSQIYQRVADGFATENDLKMIRTAITYIKNSMLDGEELQTFSENSDYPIELIYSEYLKTLREMRLMDYDDQMVYAYNILRRDAAVLEHFQNLYPYLCVDEAQDTSKIQHAIIALLASGNDNLFMVGDEDQSIYGFRAAYPEALLSFETNHPGAKILLMEENFRSDASIVTAADRFIQSNIFRRKKRMNASRKAETSVRRIDAAGRRAQYRYLVKVAEDCQVETAVLYRDNESAIPLVDLLDRKQIPFRIRNAELGFFTHRTVNDIENIMRFALDPTDPDLFLQIYYKIGSYIKKDDAVRFAAKVRGQGVPVLDAVINSGRLPVHTLVRLKQIRRSLAVLTRETADSAITRILSELNYSEYLERAEMKTGKLFILKTVAAGEASIESFLSRMKELEQIFRNHVCDPECPFILSTIHSSKGLEYDTVYLLDVADGIFPERVIRDPKKAGEDLVRQYEEERRLFYVGVTRAKNKLNLFRIEGMSTFADQLLGEPDHAPVSQRRSGSAAAVRQPAKTAKNAKPVHAVKAVKQQTLSDREVQAYLEGIGIGTAIEHERFGPGAVIGMLGDRITIRFQDHGDKTFYSRILIRSGQLRVL